MEECWTGERMACAVSLASDRAQDWARVYFVLIAAKPVEINGLLLPETGFAAKDVRSEGH